jgi:hypothetical protein
MLLWNGGSAVGVSSPGFCGWRWRRSVAWEWGESKRVRGIAFWGFCSARALARRGRRPLQRACHRGSEVAGRRADLGGVARQGSSSARQWAVEEHQGDAWAPARCRTWPGRPFTAPATALHSGGGGKTEQGAGGGRKDHFAISENSRD